MDALNKLSQITRRLILVWVPAHKGHAGNERADELAKRGAEYNTTTTKIKIGKPTATLKREIRDGILRDWSTEWTQHKEAQHTKGFYFSPNPAKVKFVYKLARLELGRFIRIITGHNNLNFFQNKLGLAATVTCRLCLNGKETFHFRFSFIIMFFIINSFSYTPCSCSH